MGERGIDCEGLEVALTVWEAAQAQMDDRLHKNREATSARLFWKALNVRTVRLQPRRPGQ
jgi:hypothetical protein